MLVLLGPSACGDSGDSSKESASKPTSTSTTTVPVPTEAELTSALLTISDLPPGWAADTSTTTTTAPGAEKSAADFLCPAAAQPLQEDHDKASAMFSQGDVGPYLLETLAAASDAPKHFAEFKGAFGACIGQTWTMDSDGEKLDMKMTEISAPKVGDESAAYRVTGSSATLPITMVIDFIVARRGSVLEVYGGINVQSPMMTTGQLSPEQFATIVDTGDKKVESQI